MNPGAIAFTHIFTFPNSFDKTFVNQKKKINIYMQSSADSYIIKELLVESSNHNDELFFYINKKNKLLSLNFLLLELLV